MKQCPLHPFKACSRLFSINSSTRRGDTIMNTSTKQTTRLIRLPEVMHKTGYKKAWIYRLISENKFPKPIKLGARSVAFIEIEVDDWISDTISNSRTAS